VCMYECMRKNMYMHAIRFSDGNLRGVGAILAAEFVYYVVCFFVCFLNVHA